LFRGICAARTVNEISRTSRGNLKSWAQASRL
jgi:hypothetical protein